MQLTRMVHVQATLLNTTSADRLLDDLPAYKELCKSFITQEVIALLCQAVNALGSAPGRCKQLAPRKTFAISHLARSMVHTHTILLSASLWHDSVLVAFVTITGRMQVIWWQVFSTKYAKEMDAEAEVFGGERGQKVRGDLRARVTEHNILVVSKYYSRLQLARLSQLLDLPAEEVHCWAATLLELHPVHLLPFESTASCGQQQEGDAGTTAGLPETPEQMET